MKYFFYLLIAFYLKSLPSFLKIFSKCKIYDILLGIFVTCKLYIKIDDFKDKDPQSLRSLGPFSIKKKESLPACSQIYPGTNSIHMILLPMID